MFKQQCQAVREQGYAGMSFFFYESLWQTAGEKPELRPQTLKTLFNPTRRAAFSVATPLEGSPIK